MTRLGEGVDRRRALNAAAARRTTECLEVYARRIERFAPERRQLIATSVLRDVADGQAYLDGLQRRFGLPWRILGGDEEAALGFAGAASGVAALPVAALPVAERSAAPTPGRLAVLDVGGGSTELAVGPLPDRATPGATLGDSDAGPDLQPRRGLRAAHRTLPSLRSADGGGMA